MLVLDANILIYAINRNASLHGVAKGWLEKAMSGRETIGLPWNVLLAFLRVTTRPGLFAKPISIESALDIVDSWFAQPVVSVIEPGPRHLAILRQLLRPLGTGANLVPDAHLAAIAIEHGAELCSTDADFGRFSALRWRNPLM